MTTSSISAHPAGGGYKRSVRNYLIVGFQVSAEVRRLPLVSVAVIISSVMGVVLYKKRLEPS